jgi:hypothetical protein
MEQASPNDLLTTSILLFYGKSLQLFPVYLEVCSQSRIGYVQEVGVSIKNGYTTLQSKELQECVVYEWLILGYKFTEFLRSSKT